MSKYVYFTKRNLENMISNLNYFYNTSNSSKPSWIEAIGDYAYAGSFYGAVGWCLGPAGVASISIFSNYLEQKQPYEANKYIALYQSWLDTINKNNFTEVRIIPMGLRTVNGIQFFDAQPKLDAYRKSNGSWVMVQ